MGRTIHPQEMVMCLIGRAMLSLFFSVTRRMSNVRQPPSKAGWDALESFMTMFPATVQDFSKLSPRTADVLRTRAHRRRRTCTHPGDLALYAANSGGSRKALHGGKGGRRRQWLRGAGRVRRFTGHTSYRRHPRGTQTPVDLCPNNPSARHKPPGNHARIYRAGISFGVPHECLLQRAPM